MITKHELDLLHRAAKLAIRGHGGAEPNPTVGCIITDTSSRVVGWGYHRSCGEAHAEINAIKAAGNKARGGTMYVTLEPCHHQGRTPPCSKAVLAAGIKRIVIGASDPHKEASGGAAFLMEAGLVVEIANDSICNDVIAPFAHRIKTGLPWIICKWAQTPEGSIETPEGESPWISSKRSQAMVHRERGRVDAIVVGVGTVVADNPRLTVRGMRKRRTPLRVVIDPTLRTPPNSHILNSDAPTLIAHAEEADATRLPDSMKIVLPTKRNALDLTPLFRHLVTEYDATNVIVEGGATLFQHIFEQKLANELWVFTSRYSSQHATQATPSINMNALVQTLQTRVMDSRQRSGDTVTRYRFNAF